MLPVIGRNVYTLRRCKDSLSIHVHWNIDTGATGDIDTRYSGAIVSVSTDMTSMTSL
ncbi:protein of unknown function [Shinella sp. WSC3-e]|nr:hypothetical protein SHINE37_44115 [Rhizobiaceae bacterium]CAK7258626.1 protein of unknown function [Shinella sp. WSC3-e]